MVVPPRPSSPVVGDLVAQAGKVVDGCVRVLVAGVVPPPRFGRENEVAATARAVAASGADLVDISLAPRLVAPAARALAVPVVATVASLEDAARAGRAGAALALVPPAALADRAGGDAPTALADRTGGDAPTALADRAGGDAPAAGLALAVVVADVAAVAGAAEVAARAGVPVAFDSTRLPAADALAAESLAVADGCRIVRTADVRRSRRVAEVLGAILAARRDHPTSPIPGGPP